MNTIKKNPNSIKDGILCRFVNKIVSEYCGMTVEFVDMKKYMGSIKESLLECVKIYLLEAPSGVGIDDFQEQVRKTSLIIIGINDMYTSYISDTQSYCVREMELSSDIHNFVCTYIKIATLLTVIHTLGDEDIDSLRECTQKIIALLKN
jgi:hypothetical protein